MPKNCALQYVIADQLVGPVFDANSGLPTTNMSTVKFSDTLNSGMVTQLQKLPFSCHLVTLNGFSYFKFDSDPG